MKSYDIYVNVEYKYVVQAENDEQAEKYGWLYEDYLESGQVSRIIVEEILKNDE